MFTPTSPEGVAISTLFVIVLGIGCGIFLLVTGLVLYIAFRYRARPHQPDPPQKFGNRRLELAWTLGPTAILILVFGFTLYTLGQIPAPDFSGQTPDLIVTGHQWWWEVNYPKLGIVTANEIHLRAGQQFLTELRSNDVVHDFWVPALGRKMDMNPGQPNRKYLESDVPGVYGGACAEYCGTEHAWMRFKVVVDTSQAFAAWQRQEQQVVQPAGESAVRGAQFFQQSQCANCHAIAGTSATADIGPNLTHLGSRSTLAAGVLANTPDNLAQWLADPQQVKPGNRMPNMQLSGTQIHDLVAYLEGLK